MQITNWAEQWFSTCIGWKNQKEIDKKLQF